MFNLVRNQLRIKENFKKDSENQSLLREETKDINTENLVPIEGIIYKKTTTYRMSS